MFDQFIDGKWAKLSDYSWIQVDFSFICYGRGADIV